MHANAWPAPVAAGKIEQYVFVLIMCQVLRLIQIIMPGGKRIAGQNDKRNYKLFYHHQKFFPQSFADGVTIVTLNNGVLTKYSKLIFLLLQAHQKYC